jgi:8-oxo-dGTP pyrophosphatase MutT (NUDIX family)
MPHLHENIDFTVEVFVVFGDKVFLRRHDKYKIWLSVGGHVELDEEPNQAALREVKEEIGLDVVLDHGGRLRHEDSERYHELIPPAFMNIHRINEMHRHIAMTFFATATTDQVVLDTVSEVSSGVKWFTAEELDDPQYGVGEDIRYYAKTALAKLGGK